MARGLSSERPPGSLGRALPLRGHSQQNALKVLVLGPGRIWSHQRRGWPIRLGHGGLVQGQGPDSGPPKREQPLTFLQIPESAAHFEASLLSNKHGANHASDCEDYFNNRQLRHLGLLGL